MNANTKNNKEFLDLATYAFHKPKTKERAKAFDKLLEFSTPYGHYENQKLTSMVIDSHFNVYWKNQEVKTTVQVTAVDKTKENAEYLMKVIVNDRLLETK